MSGLMYGGGQRVVMDLVKQGTRSGDATQVLLLGRRTNNLEQLNVETISYDGRYNRLGTLVGTALRLRRFLRRIDPGIIHTHGWDADMLGWLAVRWMAIPQIFHLHVMPNWLSSPKPTHAVRRALTRRAYASPQIQVVAVSDAVRRYWAELLPFDEGLIKVIHNGVDLAAYRSTGGRQSDRSGVPVIGVAARLVASKGIACLLDALRELGSAGIRFRLRIAGDGDQRQELHRQARVLQIEDSVEFLGQVDDMPGFFKSIDIFACPSFTEGMPVTVLESLAAGKPVVASSVGGVPEAVRNGEEGFLVCPGEPNELASALHRLIVDEKLRRSMGAKAKERAQTHFSIEIFYSKMAEVYEEMLSRRVSDVP